MCAELIAQFRSLASGQMTTVDGATWGCDDVNEGTLHNGCGDARVNGLAASMQTDAETEACIASLEEAQRDARERSRQKAEAAGRDDESSMPVSPAAADSIPLAKLFEPLSCFTLRDAKVGGPELKLYDAMSSPDRQLIKAGYFVAEGSLIIQQILQLCPRYRLASILATEAQLHKLMPDLIAADQAYAAADATAVAGPPPACVVFGGSRADVSDATGFKHSALSVLAIVTRPPDVYRPLREWLPTLTPAAGTVAPTLLVLDGVIKPENVGALFRTALAFGV